MAETHKAGDSRWMLRYEVAVNPQDYPHVHAQLGQKGAFADDFAANMERLAQEYLAAVEQHLQEVENDSEGGSGGGQDGFDGGQDGSKSSEGSSGGGQDGFGSDSGSSGGDKSGSGGGQNGSSGGEA